MRACANVVRAYAIVALLATSLAIPALAQPGHSETLSTVHIANFGSVNENYYRGAQPKGRDFDDLARLGIKTVIDLQKWGDTSEEAAVQSAGMHFVRIPMTTRVPPTPAQLAEFLALVNDPAHQPVYVHCAGGRHRTGVMTAVYRMMKDGWSPASAFGEMKRYQFGADFLHPEFKRFVLAFHPV